MPNQINQLMVRELTDAFQTSEGLIFVSLLGLTVQETERLRTSLAEQGVRLLMVRNRLAELAMKESGLELPKGVLAGNVGCCWGGVEHAIHAAKVLHTSPEKKAGKVALRAGMLEGNVLDETGAVALASLPTRDELRSMILGTITAPAQNLVGLLAAPGGALARVLQAHIDADSSSADGAEASA